MALGLGYLLARPAARRRLDELLHQAVELVGLPARNLREGTWDAAGGALLAATGWQCIITAVDPDAT